MPNIKLTKLFNIDPDFLKYLKLKFICQFPYLYNFFFGTIGFTNLGKYGITHCYPHWVNTTVFAIGTIEEKPVVRDGQITIAPMLHINLTFNHRILDGTTASEILGEVKSTVEDSNFYELIGKDCKKNSDVYVVKKTKGRLQKVGP